MLYIGDSGSGKTGSLASLAAAGYNLRILDMDNGLDVLKSYLTDPNSSYVKQDPKVAERVQFVTLTDPMKNINGNLIPAKAIAWQKAMMMLNHWQEKDDKGNVVVDLGKVVDWTTQDILVIDSLSMLSTAAMNFHLSMNGKLGASRTQNEARRDIGASQSLLRSLLELLYDQSIKCNVILTAHITLVTESGLSPQSEDARGETVTGYPSAIGRALSPHIPRYFNSMLLAKTTGSGTGTRHKIYTKSQGIIGAKNTAPLKVAPDYPLESGLADYFKAVRA